MGSKQVIVMRKDLNMRKGKMIAQGSHASMKAILDIMKFKPQQNSMTLEMPDGSALEDWIEGRFTKVCLSIDSEKELVEIYNKAKQAGLICSLITDAGLTEFGGVPTKTCCAIGPAWAEDVDKITGELKLL
jgi:PTH2 family peptidyl-tRNA hydrolase